MNSDRFQDWPTEELRWDYHTCLSIQIMGAIKEELDRRRESVYGWAQRRGGPVVKGMVWQRTFKKNREGR